ncbi:MAG: hypothetical protein VXZ72_04485 [Chlamydiota bacterium]|nr:hypothetical protein [Chlamydiota bacterium]
MRKQAMDPSQVLQNRINKALSNPQYDAGKVSDYARKYDLNLGEALKGRKLTGEQLARLTPQGYGAETLGFRNNMRALGSQIKGTFSGGVRGTSKNIFGALKRGMTESGGGFRGGVGTKMRYLPMGAKAGAMTQALPELRGAFSKEDPTGQGRSQTERVGRAVGSVAGGLLGNLPASVTNRLGPLGAVIGGMGATMLGSAAGASVLGGAGKLVDKGLSKARGVQAGDITNQKNPVQRDVPTVNRSAGSSAV